ncbi:hypothetical protein Tco_0425426 [Tanacetum coccineum]
MGENILKSIDEGPLKMGKFKERLAGGAEGALHLGPERDRVFADLKPKEKEKFVTTIKLNRGLKTSNYDQLYAYLKQQEAHANENKMTLEKFTQPAVDPIAFMSNVSPHQYSSQSTAIPQSPYVPPFKMAGLLFRMFRVDRTEVRGIKQREQLKLEIGEFRTELATQILTMFMANLSSTDPIYDTGPLYDSDILSEVQDHANYLDSVGEYREVNEMQNDVQPPYIVESDVESMSDSNLILYDQYVKDNAEQVIQSNVSSMPNDALMMIINGYAMNWCNSVSTNEQNNVVNVSLMAKLGGYKELVEDL